MALAGLDGQRKSGIDVRAEHVTVRISVPLASPISLDE